MRRRIVYSYVLLIALMGIGFAWIVRGALTDAMLNQYERQLRNEIKIASELFHAQPEDVDLKTFAHLVNQTIGVRTTIVNQDGLVLADTDGNIETMSNHADRKEIRETLASNRISVALRYSDTVNADHLYSAIPIDYAGETHVLRISMPLEELKSINSTIQNIAMTSIALFSLLAIILGIFITKKVMKPIDELTVAANDIAEGNYGQKIQSDSKDQIGALTHSFNKMSESLALSMKEIKDRNIELESILNSMINGVIAIDKDKKILTINRKSFEILNLPNDYVAENESMYRIIRNDEIAELINSAIMHSTSKVKEVHYVHLDKILRIYVNPILTSDNQTIGSIVVLEDVSQIRKLEQMRSDFVSNVSHELKTPLTSIKGFVDTLKNGALNQPEIAMRFLDIIDIESERLYRLINDILSLSEIERMDHEVEASDVQVNDVVEEVIDMLEIKAQEKGLALEVQMPAPVQMYANRDRLKQVLINLVDNAIKYTDKGSVNIMVEDVPSWVKIKVSDTGPGFSKEHKERLFERFYRIDKGRSRTQGGTGLGLSIVKHIVLLYNGQITVESEPGKGTTFEIVFPKK